MVEWTEATAGQMNDASISVTLNISERFLRRRDKETMQFLRYSVASNGELKACYYIAEGRQYLKAGELAIDHQVTRSFVE